VIQSGANYALARTWALPLPEKQGLNHGLSEVHQLIWCCHHGSVQIRLLKLEVRMITSWNIMEGIR
jgi:hypothetical protein